MKSLAHFLLHSILTFTVRGSEIIHGEKVPENSMLYMVSVQSLGVHICGGFLVSEEYVVTAAHCGGDDLKYILLGNQNLKSSKMKKISVNSTCKPDGYVNPGKGNDIMLLRLSEKVPLNNRMKTIQLPPSAITLRDNQMCFVAGWGKTEKHSSSEDLRAVDVSVINHRECAKIWENSLPPNVICAGGYGTKKGFCQGDSGGPLVCDGKAVGVVSFNRGFNCRYPDLPNVYTDISKHLQWVNNVLNGKICV